MAFWQVAVIFAVSCKVELLTALLPIMASVTFYQCELPIGGENELYWKGKYP